MKPILFILLLIAITGCETRYIVGFTSNGEKKFFMCQENTGWGWTTLRICETATECNEFCEEKRKAKQ